MSRILSLVVAATLAAACGCTASGNDEPTDTVPVHTTEVTSTTSATESTSSTTAAPTTTFHLFRDWHPSPYESPGYSCGEDLSAGCEGDLKLSVTEMWIGADDVRGETYDFIDFFMTVESGSYSVNGIPFGPPDDAAFVGSGHGVRIAALDSPLDGFDVAGEAWLELTVSSISASEFAARPANPQPSSSSGRWAKIGAPTSMNPATVDAASGDATLIEEVVLVASSDDMMQWIIGFRQPGTYLHSGGYWGYGPTPALNLSFIRQE